jgi:hypothetical protein
MICSSAPLAAAKRARVCPIRNSEARNAAAASATRHRASKAICRCASAYCWGRSQMSMSCRPVSRAMSRRSRGMAASPPRSRTRALTKLNWFRGLPTTLSGYRAATAGDMRIPPSEPGESEIHGERTTPTIRSRSLGPVRAPPGPDPCPVSISRGVGSWRMTESPAPR